MKNPIAALTPAGAGHQFVFYGDSCSGVPKARHERTHRLINKVVARLSPVPEFIVFGGDEIVGLTSDMDALRAQWRHWLDREMAWLSRGTIPLFNTTGNHTTYSSESEAVFAEMLPHLPANGPAGQERLSYFVRRGDLLLVVVHTLWSKLGGEGHIEMEWLESTLRSNADATWKFVGGHHPAFSVNGYSGPYARTIGDEYVGRFWRILRENGVMAYLCSHILAFDVQVQDGVLQITSAGAGTAHRMPEDIEYLHAVQLAVDAGGLRYQVLDAAGSVREHLAWPMSVPTVWRRLPPGFVPSPPSWPRPEGLHLNFSGIMGDRAGGERETLFAARCAEQAHDALWVGVSGVRRQLTVTLQVQPGRSPHYWFGPELEDEFDFTLALHVGMGPGGIMYSNRGDRWSSLTTSSAWGLERLPRPDEWYVAQNSEGGLRFKGDDLQASVGQCQSAPEQVVGPNSGNGRLG